MRVFCYVCGAEKKEANHWWMTWAGAGGMFIVPLDEKELDDVVKPLCGQNCAAIALERFMATGSLEVDRVAALGAKVREQLREFEAT